MKKRSPKKGRDLGRDFIEGFLFGKGSDFKEGFLLGLRYVMGSVRERKKRFAAPYAKMISVKVLKDLEKEFTDTYIKAEKIS